MSQPSLSSADRKKLRGLAMHLKPAVLVGKAGLSRTVLSELDAQLTRQQLVKVRFVGTDKTQSKALLEEMAAQSNATIAGSVGNTASLYRRNPDAEEKLV